MRAETRIHEKDDGRQAGTEPVYGERAAALVSAKVLSDLPRDFSSTCD